MYVSVHICNDPLRKFRPRCNLSYAIIHQLFSPAQALNGFMMMITQTRKLLFFTKNASEYLGHSMEDLLIHGDSIYDIVDKQDHPTLHVLLARRRAATSSPSLLSRPGSRSSCVGSTCR